MFFVRTQGCKLLQETCSPSHPALAGPGAPWDAGIIPFVTLNHVALKDPCDSSLAGLGGLDGESLLPAPGTAPATRTYSIKAAARLGTKKTPGSRPRTLAGEESPEEAIAGLIGTGQWGDGGDDNGLIIRMLPNYRTVT